MYLDQERPNFYHYHDYRNFEASDMLLGMEYVTSKGGYAIRYGATQENRLKTNNPKIIEI